MTDMLPHPTNNRGRGQFVLTICIIATLFIRPTEIVPALSGLPIYEVLNIVAIAVSFRAISELLKSSRLSAQPITVCVILLLGSVVFSHLSHLRVMDAVTSGISFVKVVICYLLLVAAVDSEARLQRFLLCLLCFTLVLTSLSLLQYHGAIDVTALQVYKEAQEDDIDPETGQAVILARLSGAGIFGNPNDLSRILAIGILLSIYFFAQYRRLLPRLGAVLSVLLMGYALQLTHSRGGLTALFAGLAALFRARFGWIKTILLVIIALVGIAVFFKGREVDIDSSSGTGQHRIQLWAEGFELIKQSPVFGIGVDQFADEVGIVAHNSYVQAFTEMGLIGGTFFVGAFYLAITGLYAGAKPASSLHGSTALEMRSCIVAIVASTVMAMLTSTRSYSYITYIVLALAVICSRLLQSNGEVRTIRFNGVLVRRLCVVSISAFICLYVYVRMSVSR